MLTRNLAIGLIIGGTIAGLALGGITGWTLNGWRLSAQVERLRGEVNTQQQSIATLKGLNAGCTASVKDVKGAVQRISDDAARRSVAAQEAMARAEKKAATHLAAARKAQARPMPAPGGECAALAREATDYAKRRKAAAP